MVTKRMSVVCALVCCACLSLGTLNLIAQTKALADLEWQTLQTELLPPIARRAPREAEPTKIEQEQTNAELVTYYLSLAGKAQGFAIKNAASDKKSSATLLELQSLLKAALLGDKTGAGRVAVLLEVVRRDSLISASDRFGVTAMSEHLLLREIASKQPNNLAVREDSARYLIREFPAEAGGYSALIAVVSAGGDREKIKMVTREVAASSAPFSAKAEARILEGRYSLIGKSLADVTNTALGRNSYFEKFRGKRVLLYTWSAASKSSIALAKQLAAQPPVGSLVLGINLDSNPEIAREVAKNQGISGDQYYSGGIGSHVALLLKLNRVSLTYLTDERGLVEEVDYYNAKVRANLAAKKRS